ncbi:MAG: hypothetical protein ACFFCO_13345 [Promethearchaeota archaeon]
MKFCPKCSNLLLPSKDKTGKVTLKCSCGFTTKAQAPKEYVIRFPIKHTQRDFVEIVEGDSKIKRQSRSIDEDERQEQLELLLDHYPDE